MAEKTVTSLFHDRATAMAAASRLETAGIGRDQIDVFDSADATTTAAGAADTSTGVVDRAYAATSAIPYAGAAPIVPLATPVAGLAQPYASGATFGAGSLADQLTSVGVDDEDAFAYAEAVRRGDVLVVVACDADNVGRVVELLHAEDVVDLDERQAAWRGEGWQGYQAPVTAGASGPASGRMEPTNKGRVRIHSPAARKQG